VKLLCRWLLPASLLCFLPLLALAGGSGLNVLVVVNQNSTNSVQLGNYYCEKRHVSSQNYLRINWSGGNADWTIADFTNYLLNPLLGMVSAGGLTNQVDYVLLSMDIPYRITQGGPAETCGVNSTTAALFYGFKPDFAVPDNNPPSCNLPLNSSNSYAGRESVYRSSPPDTAPTNALLAMMLTSSNLAQAIAIVDQGVASDGTFPNQTVILGNNQNDPFRSVRHVLFDDAIFNTRLRSNYSMTRDNSSQPYGTTNLLGYQNGMYQFAISPNTFIPGAIADSLTSFGGIIFLPNDHTTLLSFLTAGASGSYGTVIEPCAHLEKFPSPQVYFYQARGFSLAECYYQSITNPYQGLLIGEPLAAPFARPAAGAWNLPTNLLLSGVTNLSLHFNAADSLHPLQQVDLFLDGAFLQTLTNIPALHNDILYVTLAGYPTNLVVPPNATLQTLASSLTAALNQPAYSNATRVEAFLHGDRIELRALDPATPGAELSLSVSNSPGTAGALTSFIAASGTNLLDTIATGIRLDYVLTNTPNFGDYLQFVAIKTNGQVVAVSVTNSVSGATLSQFAHSLFEAVNANPNLQGSDGVTVENINMHEDWAPYGVYPTNDYSGEFNVRARGPGWAAAQVRVCLSGSPTFIVQPSGTNALNTNVDDLRARAHLYITAGMTNLQLSFAFNTLTQANGFHQLTAVAYEGSHVRTQARITQGIQVSNAPLAATFSTLLGGTNTALEATLQFAVVSNTNNIRKIELFSTGGSLGSVSNQSTAPFAVAASYLGIGLHPFYAVVTANTGVQYRTETKWFRIIGPDLAFPVSLVTPPPTIWWPATAGRGYDVLTMTSPGSPMQLTASLTPSNCAATWVDTNPPVPQRFYRVRTSN
jgi:uncharacterized protein (TIGR03790 family)